MKYKVGDLVDKKHLNVGNLGYISSLTKIAGKITVVFFDSSDNEFSFNIDYFERYYKIL
jgi:hypothetical protein